MTGDIHHHPVHTPPPSVQFVRRTTREDDQAPDTPQERRKKIIALCGCWVMMSGVAAAVAWYISIQPSMPSG